MVFFRRSHVRYIDVFIGGAKYFHGILLMIMLVCLGSCQKEDSSKVQQAPEQVQNPYSVESIYDDVLQKLKEHPDDPDLWYHLADLYDRNALYEKEIDALKQVVQLKPDMGYAYFKMGTAYSRLEKSEEAVEAFESSLKYLPNYPVAYNNLAVAYGKLGRLEDEIDALQKAIEIRPSYGSARYNLGVTYLKTGKPDKAKEQQKELFEIDERFAEELQKRIDEYGMQH